MKYIGGRLNDYLGGGLGDDVLDGGAGADTMNGGKGNDTYIVDNAGDVIFENLNEGTDTVETALSYTLGLNIENLILTGTASISGKGNTLANSLHGNSAPNLLEGGAGRDRLDGGAGADTMIGGEGKDQYFVDNAGDIVIVYVVRCFETVGVRI